MKPDHVDTSVWQNLPDAAGVYRFWGPDDELLYVGKSTCIRDRVRSHFNPSNDAYKHERLRAETCDITYETTAGDLGASLLELYEIKNRQPLLNKRSRKKKQLVIAKKKTDHDGFFYPELSRVKNIEKPESGIFGVFRSHKQATSIIETLARERELCRRKLQISTAGENNRACFYYQLGQCRGACTGREDPKSYNQRFNEAFADYAVQSWPHDGPIALVEDDGSRKDMFVINKWCLQEAKTITDGSAEQFFTGESMLKRFYYDVYKRLAKTIVDLDNSEVTIHRNPTVELLNK